MDKAHQGMNSVGLEKPTDLDQSPAKMFMGLFVLIVFVTGGFLIARMVGVPERNPNQDPSGVVQPADLSTFGSPNRSPDGSLINDPLGDDISGSDDSTIPDLSPLAPRSRQ